MVSMRATAVLLAFASASLAAVVAGTVDNPQSSTEIASPHSPTTHSEIASDSLAVGNSDTANDSQATPNETLSDGQPHDSDGEEPLGTPPEGAGGVGHAASQGVYDQTILNVARGLGKIVALSCLIRGFNNADGTINHNKALFWGGVGYTGALAAERTIEELMSKLIVNPIIRREFREIPSIGDLHGAFVSGASVSLLINGFGKLLGIVPGGIDDKQISATLMAFCVYGLGYYCAQKFVSPSRLEMQRYYERRFRERLYRGAPQ